MAKGRGRAPGSPISLPSRRDVLRLVAGVGALSVLPRPARAGTPQQWASGGTAAMIDKATYPDPFAGIADPCLLVSSATAGPCTTATDLLREDVSEDWPGLPVRLALRVVDASCNPLAGVTVKIWHTNREGSYSGQTPSNRFCLLRQEYASQDFFRGAQVSDADGRVFFDTCFPGWYRGRAIHIHFQVKDGARTYRTSQLYFPEDVTADIFASHADYAEFGQPDTLHADDGVFASVPIAERERHILTVARMSDGAMLASKTVAVVDQAPAVTPSPTREATTASPTAGLTPAPTAASGDCPGDCNNDGMVTVDELIAGVNITLGKADLASCPALDPGGSGAVTIDALIRAVAAAVRGCA